MTSNKYKRTYMLLDEETSELLDALAYITKHTRSFIVRKLIVEEAKRIDTDLLEFIRSRRAKYHESQTRINLTRQKFFPNSAPKEAKKETDPVMKDKMMGLQK